MEKKYNWRNQALRVNQYELNYINLSDLILKFKLMYLIDQYKNDKFIKEYISYFIP